MAGGAAPCRAGPREGGASSWAWRAYHCSPRRRHRTEKPACAARTALPGRVWPALGLLARSLAWLAWLLACFLAFSLARRPGWLGVGLGCVIVWPGQASPGRFLGLGSAVLDARAPGSAPTSSSSGLPLTCFARVPIHTCTHCTALVMAMLS